MRKFYSKLLLFGLLAGPLASSPVLALELNTSTLSENSWFGDDMRSDNDIDSISPAGTNLIGLTKTDLSTGATPNTGVAGHDAAIDQHVIFSTPSTNLPTPLPPALEHQGAVNLVIGNSGSGKSQISHIVNGAAGSGGGHAAGSIFEDPFTLAYSWMGDGLSTVTAGLKFGIKTSEFAALGASSRTGENVWDKLLIYEPGQGNGGTSNGLWTQESIDRDSGNWWMFDRVRGFSGTAQSNPLTIADISAETTLLYSGGTTFQDIYNLIVDPDSIITSVQFGIGSGNANGSVWVNQLESSFYRSGDITTFGQEFQAIAAVPEPGSLALLSFGAIFLAARRRRK